MDALPTALYDARGCRALDRCAIDQHGLAGLDLMRRAGAAAFADLRARWPAARRLVVVCGTGNNGGDGYVIAEAAVEAGLAVELVTTGPPHSAEAKAVCAAASRRGVHARAFDGRLPDGDLVVDALLGTGLQHAPQGVAAQLITAINDQRAPVVAADMPSGLDSDTGAAPGAAVRAAATATFIGLKIGQFTGVGREHSGAITFHDLEVPPDVYRSVEPVALRLTAAPLAARVPHRARHAHKGDAGHVLIIGGDQGMAGAVRMAGEAAARVGAGLVSLATHPAHAGSVSVMRPELMAHGVSDARALTALASRATVVAIGPGLGRSPWSTELFRAALELACPKVIDADGLNLLAQAPRRRHDWVLTPHPGEAARLLEVETGTVQRDRVSAAREIVERYGGACVLKGSGTLIAGEAAPLALCDRGNPGMASGGMGDVLTGVVAGLMAQGLTPCDAARLGVWLHATSADVVAARDGELGMLATDLIAGVRQALNHLPDAD